MTLASDLSALGEFGTVGEQLWQYWNGLPKEGLIPRRRDFDPFAIPRVVPAMTMAEWHGSGPCLVRIFGTELVMRNGCDLTGGDFLQLFEPSQRPREAGLLTTILDQPCGSISLREVVLASGRRFVTRMVTLPLRDAEGRVSLLLSTYEPMQSPSLTGPEETGIAALKAGERIFVDLGAGVPALGAHAITLLPVPATLPRYDLEKLPVGA